MVAGLRFRVVGLTLCLFWVLIIGFVDTSFCLNYNLCCLIWCFLCFAAFDWFAVLWVSFDRRKWLLLWFAAEGAHLEVVRWVYGVVCNLILACLCFILTVSLRLIVLLAYFCH